ncbi:MAG TPA: sigma-54 dependent transcriptional regulator [Polyangiaceae bacterium]|nr:sigma-54 dependent transcriptional regulator [Polyangiaceae bacterium]
MSTDPSHRKSDFVVGSSHCMRAIAQLAERVGPSPATALIRGESGTGKELVARALHRRSLVADRPFVKVDCTALSDLLMESELFGHERGAFTGAVVRKRGRVELAHGGTLFLDEVAELSLPSQAKLLRLLQDREFERVGGTETIRVDLRVVAATHRGLEDMVERRTFRHDLFYRLNVVPIWLPPLRARRQDIPDLALHFCQEAAIRNRKPDVQLDAAATEALAEYDWPGNVRQLQNLVERLVVLVEGDSIGRDDVRRALHDAAALESAATPIVTAREDDVGSAGHLARVVRDAERIALIRALKHTGGNRTAAARLLGLSRSTLYQKLSECGIRQA